MQSGSVDSRHKCLIYDGEPAEQLPVVVPLLLDGLRDNWRCLYLGDPATVELVDDALGRRGVDTRREIDRRALVLSSDRGHLGADGNFDPIAMVDGLCAAIDDAVQDGFGGLCASGDMRWELGADHNFDRLLEYEARLERVFRDKPLRGICQYRRDILPARAVRDALISHSAAFIGTTLNRDNLFYMPPEVVLDGTAASADAQGEWMCQQIIRVINAERKRDAALVALEDLNRDLERRIAERTSELQQANRELEAFSYSLSHDLRAPLRAIIGFSEALVEDAAHSLGNSGRHQLQRVVGNARRMSELIDGMLGLARITRTPITPAELDLGCFARDAIADLVAVDPTRSVDVVVHDDLRARGDAALIRAVVTNLVSNAWKFTSKRAAARIEVGTAGSSGAHRIFLVRDNGAGFDMAHARDLFGAFRRLHREEEFPGHGIGLATVERILARHDGRIWAESRPDQGATFYFTLPGPSAG
jgi:signal transduction histidine kinase